MDNPHGIWYTVFMRIVCVEPGSVGDELGLVAGDELTALDGYAVEDVFDYEYYNGAENFSMSVMRNGELLEFDIEKYPEIGRAHV